MYTGDRLNFSISFNPTAGFPLDARSYFTSLSEAEKAAKDAVDTAGSADSAYYVGQTLVVVDTAKKTTNLYIIAADKTLKQVAVTDDITQPEEYILPVASADVLGGIKVGANLTIDADGTLSATGGGGGSSAWDDVTVLVVDGGTVNDIGAF